MAVRERQAKGMAPAHDERMVVECAIYREGSRYRAVCLDLGLIVERPTAEEAADELATVIQGYVADAMESGLTVNQLYRPLPPGERRHALRKVASAAMRQYVYEALRSVHRGRAAPPRETFEHRYCLV